MPRCELSGKKPVVKNLVSHSNIKTKSRAFPNIRTKTFYSPSLKRTFRLKVTAHACRCVDKAGGIDFFLMRKTTALAHLSPFALKLRNQLKKRIGTHKSTRSPIKNKDKSL